jgi:hypothetical protein
MRLIHGVDYHRGAVDPAPEHYGLAEFRGGPLVATCYLRIKMRVPKRLTKKQREFCAARRSLEGPASAEPQEDQCKQAAG